MLKTQLAFTATIYVGEAQEIGQTAKGTRRIIPILGGEFSGERLSGVVLPGGADWQLIRLDGVAEIEALYTMKEQDGTLIYIANRGFRHGPKEVMQRLGRGEIVPPEEYYFRTTPSFEVATGKHDWLTHTVFVGQGERTPESVKFTFYEVL